MNWRGGGAALYFGASASAAQTNAEGRDLRTGGGKVVGLEGPPPPKRVGLTEWDSLEKAEAFFKSKAWTDAQDHSPIRG